MKYDFVILRRMPYGTAQAGIQVGLSSGFRLKPVLSLAEWGRNDNGVFFAI